MNGYDLEYSEVVVTWNITNGTKDRTEDSEWSPVQLGNVMGRMIWRRVGIGNTSSYGGSFAL